MYTDNKKIYRDACNIYADAFRRRANILNGHTKHHTDESANAEIKKLENILNNVRLNANKFINQVFLSKGQAKFYKELSATQVNNLILFYDKSEGDFNKRLSYSMYNDALALKNYNNAITT